ncbi:hypothetical protein I3843_09G014600 [Carya illinoinensis]|uniref:Glutaredoxin domain-containing protein n=1 Tax=Carya illinoinensis TaxID=32201 RepID=A0A922DZ91_CARIL|nr:hypothetical protein I3842_09G014800 [Carya illinoinensis]KAG7961413.1 hypothetical protein I3843_09G014600 [Carya illinoinensis]
MGCVSSKHFRQDLKQEVHFNNGGECVNHLVSLTSSSYGLLNLDNEKPIEEHCVAESRMLQRSPPPEEPEVINAWELMQDLEEGMPISNTKAKKSPKPRAFLRGFVGFDAKSPLKFSNQIDSPKKAKRFAGKENKGRVNLFGRSDYSPKGILKTRNHTEDSCNAALNLSYPVKGSLIGRQKRESLGSDSGLSSRRKSFSPLFDPELLASYEKELSEEEEQIKRMVLPTAKFRKARNSRGLESILHLFEMKCPPGGENAVVIYTTTLRGIRKTFEDCNNVRSIIESHCIQVMERDVSMDSGFKEELRGLMETKQVKVPLLFVKGRLIGGVDEVVTLEEEGKLSSLLDGIPRALGGCKGCAGVRFVMCVGCSGSCKVLDGEQMKMVRCGECNENGLIHCPICC